MAKKLIISGNYLIAEKDGSEQDQFALSKTVYNRVNKGFKIIEYVNNQNFIIPFIEISKWLDNTNADAPFTEATLKAFLELNTGKSNASTGDTTSGGLRPYLDSDIIKTEVNQTGTELVINGGNFDSDTTFTIVRNSGTNYIAVTNVNVVSDKECIITVDTGAVDGVYFLNAFNGTLQNFSVSQGVILLFTPTVLIPGDGTTAWVRQSANVTTSLGEILPSSTAIGWDKGASFGTVPANSDFLLEFNLKYMAGETTGTLFIGVNNTDPDYFFQNIDFAFYIYNTTLRISENGSSTVLGNVLLTDILAIRRTITNNNLDSKVEYLKNGVVIHTSLNTSSFSTMVFDTSIYNNLGAENIKITY